MESGGIGRDVYIFALGKRCSILLSYRARPYAVRIFEAMREVMSPAGHT